MTSETANPIQRRLSCSNRDSNSLLTLPNHAVSLASNCALSVAQDRIQAFLSLHVLHTHCNFASLPNCPHNPCLVHYSLSLATSANGCAREGDAPDLKLLLAPLHHHSHEGLPCRSLGLKCAQLWSEHPLEHWRGRPSLTRRPSFAIHLQVFRPLERGENDDSASHRHSAPRHSSSIPSTGLSVMTRSTFSLSSKAVVQGAQR